MDKAIIQEVYDFYNTGKCSIVDAETGLSKGDIEVTIDAVFNHLLKRLEGIEQYLKEVSRERKHEGGY